MQGKCIIQAVTGSKEQYVSFDSKTGKYELKDEDATLFDDAEGKRPGWLVAKELQGLFPTTTFQLILPGQTVEVERD